MKRKKSLRLENYSYSNLGAYYITICSYKRINIFGEINKGLMHLNDLGKIIQDCWLQIPENYKDVKLDDFIIMPNHIHGIIWIVGAIHESPKEKRKIYESIESKPTIHESSKENLITQQSNRVIRELPLRIERRKMLISKVIGKFKMNSSKSINIFNDKQGSHVWQRGYYDHIIRNETDLNNTKMYIQTNPLNWETDEYIC